MMTSSPGEIRNLEGITTVLKMEVQEQKGEQEKVAFRVAKFQRKKPESISLVDEILVVHLYNLKYRTFFKATFDDPTKIVADHKISMDIVIWTLEEILSGRDQGVVMSYDNVDGKDVLLIKTAIGSKIFNRMVFYKFCFKFLSAKMSFEESIDMRVGEFVQRINEQIEKIEQRESIGMKVGESVQRINEQIEKIEQRLEAIEKSLEATIDNDDKFFLTGKRVQGACFDVSNNSRHKVCDNGKTLIHSGKDSDFNTTPVTILMNTEAHRARFRVVSHIYKNMTFGVISKSFSGYLSHPSNNTNHWGAYFNGQSLSSNFQHNGNMQICGKPPSPLPGSIVTVEYHPKQGSIHYFVNSIPVGYHTGCSFGYQSCRFAVSLYHQGTKVKLLSVEKIEGIF